LRYVPSSVAESEKRRETEMMHYPGHVRDAFVEWAEAGFPEVATIEVDYEPRKEPAVVFLRRFIDCSDVMPGSTCDEVAGKVNFRRPDARGMTYAMAASVLLVLRTSGQEAANGLLWQFLVDEDELDDQDA
jgi:hypothetical protein